MGVLDDYAASTLAGMKTGAADVGRDALADIGNSYQEILMSHASISPPDGLISTVGYEPPEVAPDPSYIDASYTDVTPPETLALPPPEIDIE